MNAWKRGVVAVLVALGCLAVLGVAGAGSAWAQTTPAGSGSPAPGGPLMEQVIPQNPCPAPASGTAGPAGEGPEYPVSSYTIDYDAGNFTEVSRKAVGTLTEMTFATVRWVVGVGLWLVEWAFSFGFANRLAAPMATVARRYQNAFFVPLLGTALLISAAYAGVQIFRGRLARGLSEFAASLLLVAIFATWLLSAPANFLQASLRVTAGLSGSVASVALPAQGVSCGTTPGSFAIPSLDAAVTPLADQIQHAFIDQPYDLLEWGEQVPAACLHERDAVLAAGAGGDRDQLVSEMNVPGCSALYQFNREPSTERLGVAVLVLAASSILILSLGMVAGTVVVAQVVAVALIALMPFAALAVALPGAGRFVAWRWAIALVRALGTIVVMSAFLAFLLVAGDALLSSGQGQSLLVQMAVLNLVAVLVFALRHRVSVTGRLAASGLSRRIEARQFGWLPSSARSSGWPSANPGGMAPGQGADNSAASGALARPAARALGLPGGGDPLAARVADVMTSVRDSGWAVAP